MVDATVVSSSAGKVPKRSDILLKEIGMESGERARGGVGGWWTACDAFVSVEVPKRRAAPAQFGRRGVLVP